MNLTDYLAEEGIEPVSSEEYWNRMKAALGDKTWTKLGVLWSDAYGRNQPEVSRMLSVERVKKGLQHLRNPQEWAALQTEIPLVVAELSGDEEVVMPGCWDGLSATFFKLSKPRLKITGMDIMQEAVSAAQKRAARRCVEINFVCEDFLKYAHPYPVDTIIALRVFNEIIRLGHYSFEHQWGESIGKSEQMLAHGGKLLLSQIISEYSLHSIMKDIQFAVQDAGLRMVRKPVVIPERTKSYETQEECNTVFFVAQKP